MPISNARRNYVLGMLVALYFLNFVDRQIVNILVEPIKADLGLADWQLGVISGFAFAALYATLGIPIARMADRGRRVDIIAGAVALWSAMTAVCGLAQNFRPACPGALGRRRWRSRSHAAGPCHDLGPVPGRAARHGDRHLPDGRAGRRADRAHGRRLHRRGVGLARGVPRRRLAGHRRRLGGQAHRAGASSVSAAMRRRLSRRSAHRSRRCGGFRRFATSPQRSRCRRSPSSPSTPGFPRCSAASTG